MSEARQSLLQVEEARRRILADVSPADGAAARSLFDEARVLLQQGKAAQACPKLEESQRLDPGMGTLFNLADCYERLGRTASAWAEFREAVSAAHNAGSLDREQAAKQRAAALEPKLSYLTIVPPPGNAPAVTRDGSPVDAALLGDAGPAAQVHLVDRDGSVVGVARLAVLRPLPRRRFPLLGAHHRAQHLLHVAATESRSAGGTGRGRWRRQRGGDPRQPRGATGGAIPPRRRPATLA